MKDSYREFFANVKQYVKMNKVCKLANVDYVSFTRFMKSSEFNYCLSVTKLQDLADTLTELVTCNFVA